MLKPIEPLHFDDLKPADLSTQPAVVFEWLEVQDLLREDAYQRGLDRGRVKALVESWQTTKCAPLLVALTENGFEVMDGQHRAAAAATHGGIERLPCLVVYSTDLPARARVSVSQAKDRKAHTLGQLWKAGVVAGDEKAVTVKRVCEAARVRLLDVPATGGAYQCREMIAISTLDGVIKRRGPEMAAVILKAPADGDLAPITADAIKASEALLCDPEYAADFDADRLAASFRALGPKAMVEAKELAAAKGLPMWRALVAVIYRHRKGRTPAVVPAPTKVVAPTTLPTRRVIDRTPPAGPVPFGEPGPGRSALDQKRMGA